MKAIILAAGNARRLLPQTVRIPKTMLKVGEQSIFEHILDALRSEHITTVVVVTGHGKEHLQLLIDAYMQLHPEMHITTTYNDQYEKAGNVVSLYSVITEMAQNDVIIINSDTIFHSSILHDLINEPHPHALAIDNSKALGEEEMKVLRDARGAITRIHKSLPPQDSFGEYIGVMKIGKEAAKSVAHALADTITHNNSLYYEDGLQRAINEHGLLFVAVNTNGRPAMEIDTNEDLQIAQQLIQEIYVDHRS